jgi:serine/threonine protein kinase
MELATQAGWTAVVVVLLSVLLARVNRLLQRRKRRLAAEATRAKMLPQMLEQYDLDRDGQLNATEYTLLLHDIGVSVHMTPDKWEQERGLLGAPAAGVRAEHLEVLYSKYRLGQFEAEFALVSQLPRWPGTGGWVSDHYEIGKILGAGGEGRVYVATPTGPSRSDVAQVAVKVLDKEAMGLRFQAPKQRRQSIRDCFREIEVLKILGQHPHIVQMQSAYQCVEEIAIVLSLATGEEVAKVLARRGHFTEPDARRVVRQVCCALAHCHARRVVHRDIKPANIMYADPSHEAIMLVDFGCAGLTALAPDATPDNTPRAACERRDSRSKVRRRDEPAVVLHKVIGTTMYMAPEFFVPRKELPEGRQSAPSTEPVCADVLDLEPEEIEAAARGIEYDEKVDIWALGVVAFELLFGAFPMDAEWETELEAKIARGALLRGHWCICLCQL